MKLPHASPPLRIRGLEPALPIPTPATSTGGIASDDLPVPCPACGYDLRGTDSARCQECGQQIDANVRTGEATIPWQQRGQSTPVRAFFATVGWALLHPTRLARQAGRKVDRRAARRFQVICCATGTVPLIPLVMWQLVQARLQLDAVRMRRWLPPQGSFAELAADLAILVAVFVGLFIWLLLGSGVASYFFQPRTLPRTLQDRAIALSYYAAAPLVLLAPAVLVLGVARFVSLELADARWEGAALLGGVAAGGTVVAVVACLLWTWLLPAVLLWRGLHAGAGRVLALLAVTAVTWPALLVLTMILLPGLAFYVQVIWLLVM